MNIMITDKQKKYYKIYVQEGSYRKAGEKLGVAHTTVHEQVKAVEQKIQDIEDIEEIISENTDED